MKRPRRYNTEEERQNGRRRSREKWKTSNPKEARASKLVQRYNDMDEKHGFGKGDLTAKWIVENIFSKPCAHCGKTGWQVIGCNRLDNSKPHTMDNVEPCCKECNDKLQKDDLKKKVYQYELVPRLVKIWDSAKDTEIDGYLQTAVRACCRGVTETHKGYKWSYKPL